MNLVRRAILLLLLTVTLFPSGKVWAGGGAENVVVVVNGRSMISRRLANHYIHLRNIPASNVIVLPTPPSVDPVPVDRFREEILKPVLQQISERQLGNQIDYIVYSADLPVAVDTTADIEKLDRELPRIFTKMASITGLTYHYRLTLQENAAYLQLESNHYFQPTARAACSSPGDGPAGEQYATAEAAYQAGRYAQARTKFEEFCDDYFRSAGTIYCLARCAARQGDEAETRELLAEAIEEGWVFRNDTLAEPAFAAYRDTDWFQELVMELPDIPTGSRPTQPFHTSDGWLPRGMKASEPQRGSHYIISSILGATRQGFMEKEEWLEALSRAATADFTHPEGTFYYMQSTDVRTTTRQPGFADAIVDLQRLGHRAEVASGFYPRNRRDIAGLMMGTSRFDWTESGSEILPGAICENFTSFGGVLYRTQEKQTRLTELLRHGAAGSSGTVAEPFAIQNKFPHPHMQVHYARGASLGEAFYQSLAGPYQLLIAGDPICRPFATAPEFEVTGIAANDELDRTIEIEVSSPEEAAVKALRYELFLDGRLFARHAIDETHELNPESIRDGYHQLRVVAIGDDLTETRDTKIFPFTVNEKGRSVDFEIFGDGKFKLDEPIYGSVQCRRADLIAIFHDAEKLVDLGGSNSEFELDMRDLGRGQVRLWAAAIVNGEPVYSEPIIIEIED